MQVDDLEGKDQSGAVVVDCGPGLKNDDRPRQARPPETMLAAWQGIGGFTEERASLRTWLYKIATNRWLNARRAASRRPARKWDMSQFEPPVPTARDEAAWLQPFPDRLLEGAAGRPLGPEARYEQSEAISLAFVAALRLLPPRQLAVLILRDVLGFHASEVAGTLAVTVQSVNSALKRARASLQHGSSQPPATSRRPPQARPPRTRSWPCSPARGSRPISTRW
jgi:RNA polymerase sigma-70 factor (ECF subfamily)